MPSIEAKVISGSRVVTVYLSVRSSGHPVKCTASWIARQTGIALYTSSAKPTEAEAVRLAKRWAERNGSGRVGSGIEEQARELFRELNGREGTDEEVIAYLQGLSFGLRKD